MRAEELCSVLLELFAASLHAARPSADTAQMSLVAFANMSAKSFLELILFMPQSNRAVTAERACFA